MNKNIEKKAKIVFRNAETIIYKKGENKEYTKVLELDKSISAPIQVGTVVGKMKFLDSDGNIVRETNVVICEKIDRSNLWEYITKIVKIYGISGLKNIV